MADDLLRKKAKQRATARYGFYIHSIVFVVVNAMLFVINGSTSTETLWAIWPLMGWGLALVLHGFAVFVGGGRGTMIERLTQNELRKDRAEDS